MAYQGWKNWETWQIYLWVGNEERAYRQMIANSKNLPNHKYSARSAEDFVLSIFPQGTPDMQTRAGYIKRAYRPKEIAEMYSKVSWREIADAFNDR